MTWTALSNHLPSAWNCFHSTRRHRNSRTYAQHSEQWYQQTNSRTAVRCRRLFSLTSAGSLREKEALVSFAIFETRIPYPCPRSRRTCNTNLIQHNYWSEIGAESTVEEFKQWDGYLESIFISTIISYVQRQYVVAVVKPCAAKRIKWVRNATKRAKPFPWLSI